MDLALNDSQLLQLRNEVKDAVDAGADAPGAYALVYAKILSFIDPDIADMLLSLDKQDLSADDKLLKTIALTAKLNDLDSNVKDTAIWLAGAYLVNSGSGAFSSVIREYNRYQGRLRYGHDFSDSQLQAASNAVGKLVADTVFDEAALPTVRTIGDNDLEGVKDTLYTPNGDNLEGGSLFLNQAWPGIIMLNKLHETSYVDRLLQLKTSDPVELNNVTDIQNLLYTWASFEYAYNVTKVSETDLVDLAIGWNINTFQDNFAALSAKFLFKNLLGPATSVAKDFLFEIADRGALSVLDMLMSSFAGHLVKSSSTQFEKLAYEFFENKKDISVSWIKGDISAIANQDDRQGLSYRNALNSFSLFAVDTDHVSANLENLAIYDPQTGLGGVTDKWVQTRYEMMQGILNPAVPPIFDEFTVVKKEYYDVASNSNYVVYSSDVSGESNPAKFIFGGSSDDLLDGGGNSDKLFGGEGADTLIAGAGDDYLEGGIGADSLQGGADSDTLLGMSGDDILSGGIGNDRLEGGAGIDIYSFVNGDGHDQILDADVQGLLRVNGNILSGASSKAVGNNVWLDAMAGVKYVISGNGPEKILTIFYGLDDYVVVTNYRQHSFGIALPNYDEVPPPQPGGLTNIYGDYKPLDVSGDPGVQEGYDDLGNLIIDLNRPDPDREDFLYDSVANDNVSGFGGNDVIIGGRGGNDYIDGGSGNDSVRSGIGDDTVVGGLGSDLIFGDKGDDTIYSDMQQTLLESVSAASSSGLRGDWVDGGDNDDLIIGSVGGDMLLGGDGSDTISGGAGDDAILADGGDSTNYSNWSFAVLKTEAEVRLVYSGGDYIESEVGGDDVVFGGFGDDFITGGRGSDVLDGGDGDDAASGGSGNDFIYGGAGNDNITHDLT